MDADPSMLDHWGEEYEADFVQFDGNTPRFQAFQAGEIQAGTVTSITSFFAVNRGLPLTIVASITQETEEQYATPFVANTDSDVAFTEEGLNGKSVGICDFQASCHMWAATAAQEVGLEPEADVELVRVPFPTMGSAVAEGRVDTATMHQPFDAMAMDQHDMEAKFNAVDVLGYDHDLLEVWFSTQYLNRNEDAVRAFLEDYQTAIEYYQENTEEARGLIADEGFVQTPKEVYVNLPIMATSARPLTDSLDNLNQRAVDLGWIDEKVDPDLLYDLSYLPDSA
jgi:NitT/TauT family transport system substrate-binding protein